MDGERATLTAVINPSILLVDSHRFITVLLSRHTRIENRAIHLHGARLIRIPNGWRLVLLRMASRFWKVRLPDEREFAILHVDSGKSPSPVSADNTVIAHVADATQVIQLTGDEYRSLSEMNGRTLHRWLTERFGPG